MITVYKLTLFFGVCYLRKCYFSFKWAFTLLTCVFLVVYLSYLYTFIIHLFSYSKSVSFWQEVPLMTWRRLPKSWTRDGPGHDEMAITDITNHIYSKCVIFNRSSDHGGRCRVDASRYTRNIPVRSTVYGRINNIQVAPKSLWRHSGK